MKAHRDEINASTQLISLDEWSKIWWTSVSDCLESSDKLKKSFVYDVNY